MHGDVGDLVAALKEGELKPLRDWLTTKQVESGALCELPQWDSSRFPALLPSSRRLADRKGFAHAETLAQLPKAAAESGGVPLLLLFVLLSVEEEWEISYHYQPMWDTLSGAQECLHAHGAMVTGEDALLTRAVLALMASLSEQIRAENAMASGQWAGHEAALDAAAMHAREAIALAGRAVDAHPDVSTYVIERAAEWVVYNTAVAAAVVSVRDFLATGASLDGVIAELEAAEGGGEITDTAYLSELRAHRFSMMELNRVRHDPWLRIDRGRIVYLYPFATLGVSTRAVLDGIGAKAADWSLGGVKPLSVQGSLTLDDVWDGSDAFGRHYQGALLTLPDVVIPGADGGEPVRLQAEIRFSELGNHYVRFTVDIENAMPGELYTMMLRAAPEHGRVSVDFQDAPVPPAATAPPAAPDAEDRGWPRLADLAVHLAEDVGRCLRADRDLKKADVVARQGMFQLVVTVDAASTAPGPANSEPRREVRSATDLLDAVGAQVLTNPVTFIIGGLAEWIRYAAENALSSTATGLIGERTVRTSNTTVVIAPGVAEFTQGTRGSVAEFVATLDALFAGWSLELAGHYHVVGGIESQVNTVERGEDAGTPAPGPPPRTANTADAAESEEDARALTLSQLARALDAEKLRLNDFAIRVRSTVAFIRSPSLMAAPVAADSLRLLLECSGFQERVDELNSMIEEVTDEQLGLTIEKLARQREERQRAKLEVLLAVIAAAGVSGVIQVLQAGFFQDDTAARWAVGGVVGIVALALLLGLVLWPRNRRNQ
ncbi:hypothetical protein [Streptomyces sp. NPDC060198]|uniref:hypothetical protein n=1 Tax=Streptomyces sp. NPDC060198 TaxID=3347070 RepID=UPI003653F0C9